ncbi:hypothetical protein [Glutamicibacter sp.]|uniref:hypothetical protein n=1 Tax=Glutamicibacter sp. TaxID=1931995 RepID=UPI002B47A4FD|nr:hypothetical protein [Glutamicibacter sp.]
MADGFYFDLVDYSDVNDVSTGRYVVVRHLWEITEDRPAVNDSNVLSQATTHVEALGMKPTVVGLPGWQGSVDNPAASLAWFFDNGFYVFEIDDDVT